MIEVLGPTRQEIYLGVRRLGLHARVGSGASAATGCGPGDADAGDIRAGFAVGQPRAGVNESYAANQPVQPGAETNPRVNQVVSSQTVHPASIKRLERDGWKRPYSDRRQRGRNPMASVFTN